jgi:RNA-binding protein
LLQVGLILHQAKSGRLVVRLTREVSPGATLVDEKRRRLGRVMELMGPVKSPYASVSVVTGRLGRAGDPAFVER